jgi:thiamine phosphate synthase YjbQ (UPF0047 family)
MSKAGREPLSTRVVLAPANRTTEVQFPAPVAAQLPTLTAFDVTADVTRAIGAAAEQNGIALISAPAGPWVVRVGEAEAGTLFDADGVLNRLVTMESEWRDQLLCLLLGGRTQAVPFAEGRLCLGCRQRILIIGLRQPGPLDWLLTVTGC